MDETEVVIAGAGPTGLVLALWLARQGVAVRIVDRNAQPGSGSRAMAVQARTLELYRQLGLADEVAAAGLRNPALNVWVRGRRRARLAFGDAGRALTPFPFVLIYPQDHHERLLVHHLERAGVRVERGTELIGVEAGDGGVRACLRGPDGREWPVDGAWLVGCDGAHSKVRHLLGTDFAGGTYDQTFYVADVEVSGPPADGEIHASFERADFVLLLAYTRPEDGRAMARLIGAVKQDGAAEAVPEHALQFEDVRRRAIEALGVEIRGVNWFSTYRVHHRVSSRYRVGRVLLAGDAAHVHSPAGGQGMNTGIGDAVNLAWKLAAVVQGRAPAALLDSYERERMAFARKLVETTDRVFSVVTAEGNLADVVRTRIAPLVAALAYGIEPVRATLFRVLSQTGIHYRDSILSEGQAGRVHGGDRLPWTGYEGPDNHATFDGVAWQAHVYGEPKPGFEAWCFDAGVMARRFDWHAACGAAGLARDAVYLVRPDGHVALAEPDGDPAALQAYFAARDIKPAPVAASVRRAGG
ncbi:FAD-dependent monooxygenase [Massilia sp. YIM B02763]|uniref:FAD-dependent monooxygenase n=1 Tax=Massilia sp. YIM B02763 TaxID=3050130 RepID=UPI0025B634A2|nr:FAD-dependent monooxygenase [Massilia sp. YIM B02763]MDN4051551.1 FAD-dependent monooxygenase [Massilia sp. YIM B02763]